MDPHVYDTLFERRQAELEREAALRRLGHELRAARQALRADAVAPVPRARRRAVAASLGLPRHA